jgi:chloride channel protein, CIC family
MWGPAVGGLAVGLVGFVEPATLGVGYDNVTRTLQGQIAGTAVLVLALLKFLSWSIALGSGTSGGTLAPLLTVGGGFGAAAGAGLALLLPHAGVDPRVAALVGMAAMFAGASRALLASVVFAFETTLQGHGLLPLLGGCSAAYLVSCLLMPTRS